MGCMRGGVQRLLVPQCAGGAGVSRPLVDSMFPLVLPSQLQLCSLLLSPRGSTALCSSRMETFWIILTPEKQH